MQPLITGLMTPLMVSLDDLVLVTPTATIVISPGISGYCTKSQEPPRKVCKTTIF